MKRYLAIIALLMLAAASASAAQVTSVGLSYQNGATVATVAVEGQFQIMHQTEVPKDGKPDRLILDIMGATNELPVHNFANLPNCPVKGIRTSQYAVTPQKVVRLVFDMNKAPIYRVESDNGTVRVIITDNTVTPFAAWVSATASKPAATSKTTTAPKTTAQKNQSIEQDRLASLSNDSKTATPSSVPSQTPPTPAPKPVAATTPQPTTASPTSTAASKPAASVTTTPTAQISAPAASAGTPVQVKPAVTNVPAATDTPPSTAPATTVANKPTTVANPQTAKPASPALTTPSETKPSPTVAAASKPTAPETKSAPATASSPITPAVASTPTQVKPVSTTTPATEEKHIQSISVYGPPSPTTSSTPNTGTSSAALKEAPSKVQAVTPAPTNSPQTPTAQKPSTPPVTGSTPTTAAPSPTTLASKPAPATPESKPMTPATAAGKLDAHMAAKSEPPKSMTNPTTTVATSNDTSAKTTPSEAAPASPTPDSAASADKSEAKPNASPQLTENDMTVDSTKSTARFRRNAAASAKIKGTMVAEFPQRLIIKYQSQGARDPFATLLDDYKQTNAPTERRAPNVEGLKLVGVIVSDAGENSALFEDKNGFSYILRSGDKVQKGYVLRVESRQVYFQIFEYGWSRTIALSLESSE